MVGDPAQTIYSFAGANAAYLRDFAAEVPAAPPRSSWSATTAPPPRWSRPPTPCSPAPRAGGVELRAQRPSGPAVTYTPRPTRSPRPRRSPPRIARLRRAGTPPRRDRRAVPDQRPVRGLRGGPRRARHPLRRARRRPLLRPRRRSARRSPGCAAPPGRRRRDERRSRPCAATLSGMGWTAEAPTARGQTRDRWESLAGAGRPGRRSSPRRRRPTSGGFVDDLDRRASEQHAPVADGVTLATFHAAKGLEWDAVFLVRRCRTARCRSPTPTRPRRDRGGAPPALRRHDPRPRRPRALLGAGPQPRWPRLAQAVALPRPAAARRARSTRPRAAAATARWPAAASAASR